MTYWMLLPIIINMKYKIFHVPTKHIIMFNAFILNTCILYHSTQYAITKQSNSSHVMRPLRYHRYQDIPSYTMHCALLLFTVNMQYPFSKGKLTIDNITRTTLYQACKNAEETSIISLHLIRAVTRFNETISIDQSN